MVVVALQVGSELFCLFAVEPPLLLTFVKVLTEIIVCLLSVCRPGGDAALLHVSIQNSGESQLGHSISVN